MLGIWSCKRFANRQSCRLSRSIGLRACYFVMEAVTVFSKGVGIAVNYFLGTVGFMYEFVKCDHSNTCH